MSSDSGTAFWILRGTDASSGLRFRLAEGGNRVGTRRENPVCLESPGISKHHAVLRVTGDQVTVEDLASKNGTFVNGRRVQHTHLAVGDVLGLATVSLRLERILADDAELAIRIDSPSANDGDSGLQETPWVARDDLAHQPPVPPEGLVFPEAWLPGDSPAMLRLLTQVQLLSDSLLPVLVLGETGVGKEGMAQTLHRSSPRASRPFVAINCAAIPDELLEAELFGIGSGVATGVRGRAGRFVEAAGGTLFLDEIGDLPTALQAKLLRVLQEGQVEPLGQRPQPLDVRLVAATHSDLATAMATGRFRRDLFYRLAGVTLHLPPLRERREDIPGLVAHFSKLAVRNTGKDIRGITRGALRRLSEHTWPGNVRQLRHTVERCVLRCPNHQVIDAEAVETDLSGLLGETGLGETGLGETGLGETGLDETGLDEVATPPALAALRGEESERGPEARSELDPTHLASLDLATIEKALIREALRRSGGHLTRAASELGLSRQALRRRMARHGLGSTSD